MRSQKCSKCSTLLDVSRMEKGSKFACATCGTVLIAGEAVAVKRSLSDSGPAFQSRTSKAKAEAPAEPTRRRREAAPGAREEAAPSGSRTPLYAGMALLIVAGVVAGIMMSGDKGGGGAGGSGGVGGSGGGGDTAQSWWDGVRDSVGQRDGAGLRALLAEGRARGYQGNPGFWKAKEDEIYAALLTKDPEDAEANRRAGREGVRSYPGFDKIWAQMLDHYKVLPEELRGFVARHEAALEEGKDVWYEAGSFGEQKALLDGFVSWKKEFDADPSAEQAQKGLNMAGQFAKDFGGAHFVARPFLLYLASRELRAVDSSPEDVARREKQEASLAPKGNALAAVLAVVGQEFDKRYRAPLGLAPIPNTTVFYQWVYDDGAAYGAHVRSQTDILVRPEGNALFAPRLRWVLGWQSEDAAIAANFPVELAAAAVQQLQWHFSKEKYDSYYEEWGGLWFNVGLSEYLAGGIKVGPGAKATFSPGNAAGAAHLKLLKESGLPFMSGRQIVEQRAMESFRRWQSDYWSPLMFSGEEIPESAHEILRNIPNFHWKTFVAESWALAHYLQDGEGGKYKQAYLDLVMTALRGRKMPASRGTGRWDNSFAAFEAILNLSSTAEWNRFEEGFAKFLKELAR